MSEVQAVKVNGHRYVYASEAMQDIMRKATLVAATNIPVHIQGETGTGKELLARYIHEHSQVRSGPYQPYNLAAIPESIAEAELFGVAKGAFTGAETDRVGYVAAADGGTLFLDEIAQASLPLQAKLLRVLQEQRFYRLGDTQEQEADFRLVSATNIPLEQAVREGTFREDLLYRVQSFTLTLPPLRERPEDIMPLARHFARQQGYHLAQDTRKKLEGYAWPGNIRQLQGVISSAIIFAEEPPYITAKALAQVTFPNLPRKTTPSMDHIISDTELVDFDTATSAFERTYVLEVLERAGWNATSAAKKAGISRTYMHRLMKKHDIKRPPKA